MRCPTCEQQYDDAQQFCPADGTRLLPDGPRNPTDPLVGTVLQGRYRILERVGQGGMGAVYRAVQVNIDRDVAVKVLTPDAAEREHVVRRFENEARIISKLRHPNTLKLIDFGEADDERLFLVAEFLSGQPLDAVLRQGAIGVGRTLHVMAEAADSLAEAHGQGIVHRDLKPGNLFLERVGDQDVIKVLDFGIAKLATGTSYTVEGTVFGTPAYMSPEQARGESVDSRSDLYSLGVIAYECLCGSLPFHADSAVSLLLKHVSDPPKPLRERNPTTLVPPAVDGLVLRLLAKDPADRPASAADLKREIVALVRQLPDDELRGGVAALAADSGGYGSLPSTPAGPTTPVTPADATTAATPTSGAHGSLPHADTLASDEMGALDTEAIVQEATRPRRGLVLGLVAAALVLLGLAGWLLLGRAPDPEPAAVAADPPPVDLGTVSETAPTRPAPAAPAVPPSADGTDRADGQDSAPLAADPSPTEPPAAEPKAAAAAGKRKKRVQGKTGRKRRGKRKPVKPKAAADPAGEAKPKPKPEKIEVSAPGFPTLEFGE